MKNGFFKIFTIGLVGLLGGCASLVNGENQSVFVETGKVQGASCSLSNDKGTWHLASSPGFVQVLRTSGDLVVGCQKNGVIGHTQASSSTSPMVLGNIALPGGILGTAVDFSTGSAFDYPAKIDVPLV